MIIESLGNMALAWVPEAQQITIYPDADAGSALVEVCLRRDDWQLREAAIDKMVELRSMFIDDLALSYRFSDVASLCAEEMPGIRQFA